MTLPFALSFMRQPGGLPVNTVAPVVSNAGAFLEPEAVLSCTQGTWGGDPAPSSFTYQWRRGGVDIAGETASSYTLVVADSGAVVDCVVTATNAIGNASHASNDLGTTLNRRMVPHDLSGCVAWYDPNEPGGGPLSLAAGLVQSGGRASQLTDLSGNGRHLVQATGANQPAVVTKNSRTAVYSDASSRYMVTAAYTATNGNLGQIVALVYALTNDGITTGSRVFAASNTAGADTGTGAMRIRRATTTAVLEFMGGSNSSTVSTQTATYEEMHTLTFQRDETTLHKVTKDGGTPVTTGVSEAASLGFTRHIIFSNLAASGAVGTAYNAGTMGPVALMNVDITDADRQKLEGILAWRANVQGILNGSHPYLSSPPRI